MHIFLISGKARHGKDSTAKILEGKLNRGTLILHNADVLKFYAEKYGGWDGAKDEKGREFLQWLGTQRVRKECQMPCYWVERVCEIIKIFSTQYGYFIVADTRFPNEIKMVYDSFYKMNVTTIRVNRLNFDNGLTKEQKAHESETSLDNYRFDITINSESGLDNLEKEFDKAIQNFKEEHQYLFKEAC